MYYEKLPDYCFFSGLMGHTVEECRDGVHDPSTCEWGSWFMWNFDTVPKRQNFAREGGRGAGDKGDREGGGRGDLGRGGGGRGQNTDTETCVDMDYLTQDARSGGEIIGRGPRKRLVGQDGSVNMNGQLVVPIQPGTVAGKVL